MQRTVPVVVGGHWPSSALTGVVVTPGVRWAMEPVSPASCRTPDRQVAGYLVSRGLRVGGARQRYGNRLCRCAAAISSSRMLGVGAASIARPTSRRSRRCRRRSRHRRVMLVMVLPPSGLVVLVLVQTPRVAG